MSAGPLVDAAWRRVPGDQFGSVPQLSSTPTAAATHGDGADSDSSEWSYEDETELITLDLGNDRSARRALLGFNAPSSADFASANGSTVASAGGGASSWSTARSVRASRPTEKSILEQHPSHQPYTSSSSLLKSHLATDKMFSLTGLDTHTPILKIDNTVLKGKRVDTLGTEIVLEDHIDATKPKGSQHHLRPLNDQTTSAPTTRSSTTRKRILFQPIYDPTDNERLPDDVRHNHVANDLRDAVNAVKSTTQANTLEAETSTKRPRIADSGRNTDDDDTQPATLPEEEVLVRRAERSIKKAARALRKQQKLDSQNK